MGVGLACYFCFSSFWGFFDFDVCFRGGGGGEIGADLGLRLVRFVHIDTSCGKVLADIPE